MAELDSERLTWIYTQMLRIREFEERVKRTFEEHPGVIRGHTHLADGDAPGGHRARVPGHLGDRGTGNPPGDGRGLCRPDPKAGSSRPVLLRRRRLQAGRVLGVADVASLWKLPIVYVMENNSYNVVTRVEQEDANAAAGEPLAVKAKAFSMPGVTVDGSDPLAVYDSAGEAVARARDGGGPTLVESLIYRLSAKGLMASAIRDDNPVCFFHHYLLTLKPGEVPEGEHLVPFGEAVIRRSGGDVTIVATGWMVGKALAAAESLASEGIEAEVIDPRTLAPLDMATILTSVEKTGHVVLVDQAPRHASASAVIAAEIAEEGFSSLEAPLKQVTSLDATVPYSEPMEAYVLPDEAKIAGAVHQALGSAPVAA